MTGFVYWGVVYAGWAGGDIQNFDFMEVQITHNTAKELHLYLWGKSRA